LTSHYICRQFCAEKGERDLSALAVNTAQKNAKKQLILLLQYKKRAIVCSERGAKIQKIKEGIGV
jgi:hypothetical protein